MKEIARFTRTELGRRVYGLEKNFSSIEEPISELMDRIKGAELISENIAGVGDNYCAIYFLSEDAVHFCFKAKFDVRLSGSSEGAPEISEKLLNRAYNKLKQGFKDNRFL